MTKSVGFAGTLPSFERRLVKRSTLRWFGFRAGTARSTVSSLRASAFRPNVVWSKRSTLRAFDFRAGTARSMVSSLRAFAFRPNVAWSKGLTLRAIVYRSPCLHMPIYIRVFSYQRKCSIICISCANSARLRCAHVSNARILVPFDQQLSISKRFDCKVVSFGHCPICICPCGGGGKEVSCDRMQGHTCNAGSRV